jgi:hypothetical protein
MSKRNEKEPYDIIIYSYLIIIKNLILRRLKNDEKITAICDFDVQFDLINILFVSFFCDGN